MEKKLNLGEPVKMLVSTRYGAATIIAQVIAQLPEDTYGFIAQDRVFVAKKRSDLTWEMSEPLDLLDLKIKKGVE